MASLRYVERPPTRSLPPRTWGVERCLREQHVNAEIRHRNQLAHGDWFIPEWVREETTDAAEAGPPAADASLIRVQHHKPDPLAPKDLSVDEIDEWGKRLELLGHMVWEFGSICLHLDAHHPRLARPTVTIADAFALTGPANDRHVQFREDYRSQQARG